MNDNEGIRVKEVSYCLLCGDKGEVLYNNQKDRLIGVPGVWSLMQCPSCQLVWLNPQPIADDIGKPYACYFAHKTMEYFARSLRQASCDTGMVIGWTRFE